METILSADVMERSGIRQLLPIIDGHQGMIGHIAEEREGIHCNSYRRVNRQGLHRGTILMLAAIHRSESHLQIMPARGVHRAKFPHESMLTPGTRGLTVRAPAWKMLPHQLELTADLNL